MILGHLQTSILSTIKFSLIHQLFLALDNADFTTLYKFFAAFLGVNSSIVNASSTFFHLINFANNNIFFSESIEYFSVAVILLIFIESYSLKWVSSKCSSRNELSKSMSNHFFSNINTYKLLSIMNCKSKTYHIWNNTRSPIPNLYYFFISRGKHLLNILYYSIIHIKALF